MAKAVQSRNRPLSSDAPASQGWSFDAVQGFATLRAQEWLLTNGLGGFAMGSAAGVPTRRYHGLLIGATKPPVGRVAALNAMVEQLDAGGRNMHISTFEFNARPDPISHPDGASHLVSFEFDDAAKWHYIQGESRVTRSLVLVGGANAAIIRYTIQRSGAVAKSPARFTARPLVSLRDFHGIIRRGWADTFRVEATPRRITVFRDGHELQLETAGGNATFIHDEQWWHDFFYREDAARGQDCVEDLFSPGHFEIELKAGETKTEFELLAWLGVDRPASSPQFELEMQRRRSLALSPTSTGGKDVARARAMQTLARSAEDFIVARQDSRGGLFGVSTIAGYPWFSDWGRDAFISLDGLFLATGKFDEARRELESFARARRNGIIPNVFNDRTGEPEFNTVDASLWFVHAACRWMTESGDRAAFESTFLDACIDVVQHYRRGTDFNIAMDPIDKLITAGTNATQLTWMDAQRDGVTFTPRHGKAVEINALWYNALRSLAASVPKRQGTLAADLNDLASAVGRSIAAKFWDSNRGCLFDCLTPGESAGWIPDQSFRPNQIFAASLPHSALSAEQRQAVIKSVRSRLVTPMGVRTLDPADPSYRALYTGTLFERDSAYHQGTAWPWLLGPVAEAVLRAGEFSPASKSDAMSILDPLLQLIAPGRAIARPGMCVGHIPEVFDGGVQGSAPQRAGGCPAQAWSLAEALRILKLIGDV